jgi:hypothetical protein
MTTIPSSVLSSLLNKTNRTSDIGTLQTNSTPTNTANDFVQPVADPSTRWQDQFAVGNSLPSGAGTSAFPSPNVSNIQSNEAVTPVAEATMDYEGALADAAKGKDKMQAYADQMHAIQQEVAFIKMRSDLMTSLLATLSEMIGKIINNIGR